MRVGIGFQNIGNARESGILCAEAALLDGKIDRPDLVIAFCSGLVVAEGFFEGLQSVLGAQTPIIGGSAIGIITQTDLSYEGHPAGIAILQSDTLHCSYKAVNELDKNELEAGKSLANLLSRRPDDKMLLMFYDSVKTPATENSPPVLNASPPLIRGIESGLGGDIPVIGAGLLGDFAFGRTHQFCGTHVDNQSVVGAILGGEIEPYYQIMHGCTLMDGVYHTITRMEGDTIYELDNQPIVEIIDAMYGNQDWQKQMPVNRLAIGVNMGEKYSSFKEAQYVNRLIAGVLPDRDGIVIFEPDLENGMEVQFMLRDANEIIKSTRRNTSEIMDRIKTDGRRPLFGLYIDCAGRNALSSETLTEEATEVMSVFKSQNTPLLGFYSGVEVAPFLGKSRGLDWTGVLVVIAGE